VTDVIHFLILMCSLAAIAAGLWMIYPPAMFVCIGSIGFAGVVAVRVAGSRKRGHV